MILAEYSVVGNVVAALADTTATNFGQWSGAITILQVESFYYSVLHHIPYPI